MKTQQELCDILGFIAEYATYQLGSGVHTSRVIRNAQRIGEALGVDVQLSSFQKSTILTVLDTVSGESATRVVAIPSLPISFERNSDLSALSWDALDEGLSLDEIRSRYRTLVDKPRMDPIFTLVVVGLANASFCKLFGGDWTAVDIVFTATLVGFAVKQRMQAHAVNHFLVFACSAFVASLCATAALRFDCTAEIALATSPLFLVPGVPLINGVIDIMEGHVLMGGSRLVNALLQIVCIAVGLSATLLMVKIRCYDRDGYSARRPLRRCRRHRIRGHLRPADAGLSTHRPACRHRPRLAFHADTLCRTGYRHRIAFRGLCNRHGQPVARPRRPLPDDLPLHSGSAADGAGHLRLQDGLLAHHVPPVARSGRRGYALHATVLSQCHRIAECHCAACRRCHAADIHLQTPGFLDDPTHTKK